MTEIRLDDEPDEAADGGERSPGSPRSRWITAYAVALAVLAVAVVSFVEVVGGDPDDVVTDYLGALRDGDTTEALELATVKPKQGDPRDSFLRADALRANWRITSVETRVQSSKRAIVDASIAGPDGRRDGLFRLELSRAGKWRITNPFVPLYLARPPVRSGDDREAVSLSLNGVTVTMRDHEPASGVTETSGIQLRLFPGTYAFFDGDEMVRAVDATRTWLPPGDSSSFVPYTPWLELTDTGAELAEDRVGEILSECENRTERLPDGCPFGTDAKIELDGDEHAIDGDAVTWKLDDDLELFYADSGLGYFQPVVRRPVGVALTATVDGETKSVECDFDWAMLGFRLSTEAALVFTYPYETPDTCP
ncbi:hypothetical protein [Stackebrandtia nassauensis]|uniref:DUF4878 domain-containing protein n=1 Tax=Stackebrandtia nassauensis (strain DSM 44728 / CIP 108903 / NRRL B-16338 / NBRC 102104 / LLR-40K-21) TaxID=446470 RepID=D3PZK5_STANL|nr:hypothetical protein [Stackebrandtia nassauensis]ADD41679.1 hypothetical protein Snas_1983 [Stackebrandtia nassauensis DSM 44728]